MDEYTSNKYTSNKYTLIILVFACETIEKYRNQIELINSTWGKKCKSYKQIKLLFFLSETKTSYFTNSDNIQYINLNGVSDDYLSASYKQFLGLKYIYDNYKTKYILCIGSDTYLNIPKLLLFIDKFNYNDYLYIGGHGDYREIESKYYYYHSGGPGFIITYNCLEKIHHILPNLVQNWLNICDRYNLVRIKDACDVAISYYLQQQSMDLKIIKIDDLSFIHCNYKGIPCHPNRINMSNIISCHLMSPDDFINFTKILDENNYFIS
jgi:hypothetical protein